MKKILLSMALTLAIAFPAFAAVKDFATFSVDVPDGWTVVEATGAATLMSSDNKTAVVLTLAPTNGASAKDFATTAASQIPGAVVKEEGSNYTFFMDAGNGMKAQYIIVPVDAENVFLVVLTGEAPELPAIIKSLAKK